MHCPIAGICVEQSHSKIRRHNIPYNINILIATKPAYKILVSKETDHFKWFPILTKLNSPRPSLRRHNLA